MCSTSLMKIAKTGYIIISAALCAAGIFLIAAPEVSSGALGMICGLLMMIFGAVKLAGYFSKDLFRLAFQHDLASGILIIILGFITVIHPRSVINFLCVSLGIAIMADGLLKLQTAFDSKKFGIKNWWLILVSSVLTCALGSLLLFRMEESSRVITALMGAAILAEGLLNLCTVLSAVKIIKHQKPDVIDAKFNIEGEN